MVILLVLVSLARCTSLAVALPETSKDGRNGIENVCSLTKWGGKNFSSSVSHPEEITMVLGHLKSTLPDYLSIFLFNFPFVGLSMIGHKIYPTRML